MSDFFPGEYEVTSAVAIRREPRVVEYWQNEGWGRHKQRQLVTNQVGSFSVGRRVVIESILTTTQNETWGRVSGPDPAGVAQWICMKNANRTFVQRVEEPKPLGGLYSLEWIDDRTVRLTPKLG